MTTLKRDLAERHFKEVVEPAIDEFVEASIALVAQENLAPADFEQARLMLWRRVRTAVIELHQFADHVCAGAPAWGPGKVSGAGAVRDWLIGRAKTQQGLRPDDIATLGDIADVFKHARLQRKTARIISHTEIAIRGTGFGEGGWGEGPWGGGPSVVVGPLGQGRHVSAIIRNVHEIWVLAIAGQI